MRPSVSVLVTARDEEAQLPGALASVAGWAAETVVVVDPRTVDRTAEVAGAAGTAVLTHAYASSAAQCNWGIERCAHDWVFVLDADERATPALGEAVARALAAPAHAAYSVRRTNLAFGRPLRFGDWGADRIVRLLDRRRARFEERAVHGAVVAPSVGHLGGAIEHHTLRSLPQYAAKLHDYARRGADDLIGAGRRTTVVGAAARSEWRFVRAFVLRLGFLDGGAGFVVAVLGAYGTFLKWAAVWDATTRRRPVS